MVLSSRPSPICLSPSTASPCRRARLGLVGLEEHLDLHVARRDAARWNLLVRLDAEERVGVVQQAVLVRPRARSPPMKSALATITPSAPPSGTVQLAPRWRRSGPDARDHRRAGCSARRRRTRTRVTVGSGGRMPKMTDMPPISGSTRLRSASCHHSSWSSATFSGMLGGHVVRLREVVGQVVELPADVAGPGPSPRPGPNLRERLRGEVPRAAGPGATPPTSRPCTWRGCRTSRSTATVCRSGAWASSSVYRKLVPSIGSCSMPSTVLGSGMPAASRMVGPTSMQWVNWERIGLVRP